METLRLKSRPPVEDTFENWDDDDFLIDGDDLTVISHNTSLNVPASRRDSHSSFRSDFESIHGDEEKHVILPGDDEKSTLDAIAAAAKAGIPIPKNVPPSALMGGTIKRLGGRKIKKIIQEDWVDDLEFPDAGQTLKFKQQDGSQFPEVLRQVSGSSLPSPVKPAKPSPTIAQEERKDRPLVPAGLINLDRFRDMDEDDDFFGDGGATIKMPKRREALKPVVSLITPPTPQKAMDLDDDFETDFELPGDGRLRLSTLRDIPKTPLSNALDDLDWAEGSLGTRFGGTRRDAFSNRSSSVSALSPSIASSMTAESEDETFDGLLLPNGPIDFERRLHRQRRSRSPERIIEEPVKEEREEKMEKQDKDEKEDFLAGLDIGDGEVFDSRKLTLHRNLQLKETRPASPCRPKTSIALKFNKPGVVSRLPRPMGPPVVSHERTHTQSSLEPVSESGGSVTYTRRSLSRLGHSAQSSINSFTSIGAPTTPSSGYSIPPATPRRKELGQKTSVVSLRTAEPTTTSAQLLRLKRSLPAMRGPQSPARPPTTTRGFERPPSRNELGVRPGQSMRPKTPVERMRASESAAAQARKPFLPAGSGSSSHNVLAKSSSRVFRRHDSENSIEFRPNSRAVSRSTVRSPSPLKHPNMHRIAPEVPWQQLHKPRRSRHFGDGHELDGFDDLPTSSQAEARYLKQPIGSGPPKAQMRNRLYQNILPDRSMAASPFTPYSASRVDNVPSWARDTAASRIARETSLAQRVPSGPLAPLTTQRVAQLSARSNYNAYNPPPPQSTIKSKKVRRTPQLKPHLIANLNPPKDTKVVKGMCYNPETYRWEGNDNVLSAFEAPASSPSTASMRQHHAAVSGHLLRERESGTPRPALITNIGTVKGVQVVGGMVFDPQNMCWLKMAPQGGKSEEPDPMDGFNAMDEEDEDVFKGIPDLEDHTMGSSEAGQGGRVSDIKDDWLVGEEFDVGPEFIRRQREEEERWRKKCHSWVSPPGDRGDAWKWAIRDIVAQTMEGY